MSNASTISSVLTDNLDYSTASYSVISDEAILDNVTSLNNVTSNGTNFPGMFPPYSPPQLQLKHLIIMPVSAVIFILSVVGNLLVILTLIQNKRMRTVTNVFLLNLSVSDLLLAVLCMPFTIIPMILENFVFGEFICITIRYMQAVVVSVSCFTLVAISLERYFAICRPLHSRQWQTLKHSYRTIAVCWIIGFAVSVPVAVFTKFIPLPAGNNMCREIWNGHRTFHVTYTIALVVVLLLLPVAVMAVSYGYISYTLWIGMKMDQHEMDEQNGHSHIYKTENSNGATTKDGFGRIICPSEINELNRSRKATSKMRFTTRGIRQTNQEKSRIAKKRVIKMLFAIVLEFFICWTPVFVVQTWVNIDGDHAHRNIAPAVYYAFFLLSYISSCCNPITYCFMNKNFRNGFKVAFRRCKCKRGIRARHEMPSYFQYSSARTNCSNVSAYDRVNGKDESDEF